MRNAAARRCRRIALRYPADKASHDQPNRREDKPSPGRMGMKHCEQITAAGLYRRECAAERNGNKPGKQADERCSAKVQTTGRSGIAITTPG